MTINDIELNLPNGFHDIAIKKITIDYENKTINLVINVDETEKEAELLFSGVQEFSLNAEIAFNGDSSLWVTDFGTKNNANDVNSDFYFFISNLNAFLNFKTKITELRWRP